MPESATSPEVAGASPSVEAAPAAAPPSPEPRTPWAMELSCRYLFPFLAVVEDRQLGGALASFLAPWGASLDELRKESNWVSRRFCENLVEWLAEQVGEDELVAQTTRMAYDRRALGFLYPLLRAMGSPARAYHRLPENARNLNKISAIRILRSAPRAVEIEYGVVRPELRERSALVCKIRRAQLASVPRLWNLPDATVESLTCQAHGDETCRYSIRWVERPGILGVGMGALTGLAAAALLGTGASLTGFALVLAGILAGRIRDVQVAAAETKAYADERQRALREAAADAEKRFEELQKAKQEVDLKVEQRTRELRIATEKRVQMEKLAVLGTLAAGMAHEVSNPANAIINGLPRVKRELVKSGAPEKVVMMVDISIDCANRISAIVADLLDLGRAERAEPQPWSPERSLDAAVRILNTRTTKVEIERDYNWNREVIGRAAALNQVLLNLLDNAFRAVAKREAGVVRLTTRDENGGLVVLVEDNGPGVRPEVRTEIFNPFFTTRDVGDGTGIGLHFSRRTAEEHGGSLDLLDSQPGRGACFRLWLPPVFTPQR